MAGKKGENSKKAAGQARKAETAAKKAATEDAKKAAVEDADWERGSKNNSKKEAQAAKKAEQAQKKADREAALAEEEKSLPSRPGPKNSKTATKKTNRGLDNALSELNASENNSNSDNKLPTLEASGIENILDALGLILDTNDEKYDRHAERRVGAAFAAFEKRRLEEMSADGSGKGLRLSKKRELLFKEFRKSPENPLNNNYNVRHNATKAEVQEIKEQEKAKTEARLTSK
ncbi:DUF1014-domain-containing protein [Annulohypoxylon maeteangense]|uniref:DUF1014-domain-containing protein n=1 Tax=Annulohypoxylon maeteangense TaxID=1927788 RepID=UPI002007D831|nr:DUF1014-domain-containing protein [Annulohypoxylon maeteangense]KAI0888952.1 DUF1014-domain-containing protein [Annulohypoxylon maeteangense]